MGWRQISKISIGELNNRGTFRCGTVPGPINVGRRRLPSALERAEVHIAYCPLNLKEFGTRKGLSFRLMPLIEAEARGKIFSDIQIEAKGTLV